MKSPRPAFSLLEFVCSLIVGITAGSGIGLLTLGVISIGWRDTSFFLERHPVGGALIGAGVGSGVGVAFMSVAAVWTLTERTRNIVKAAVIGFTLSFLPAVLALVFSSIASQKAFLPESWLQVYRVAMLSLIVPGMTIAGALVGWVVTKPQKKREARGVS